MPNKKISALTALGGTPAAGDKFALSDADDLTESKSVTYTNLGVPANTTHSTGDGSDHADVATNTTHSTGDGSDHADVATNTTHSTGDGSDHADVATNTTHSTGDGSDHADVASNNTHRTNEDAVSGIVKCDGASNYSAAVADTDYAAATHASRHQSAGADAIKLDDLASPEDNTDLNVSTSAHGLCPKLDNVATNFLNGQGGFTEPAGGLSDVVDDTSPQLGGDLDLNEHYIQLEPSPSADDTGSGDIVSVTVDANTTGIGAALYMASDGNYEEADADAAATMPCSALALETGTGTKKVLLKGYMRNDGWNWGTVGGLLYVDTTTGALTQTKPSGSGDQVQIVGYATHADRIFFNPDYGLIEV